jgi:hypothetical protein
MPRTQLSSLILNMLENGQALSVDDIVCKIQALNPDVYESDVKSVLLALVRLNKLNRASKSEIQLADRENALVPA